MVILLMAILRNTGVRFETGSSDVLVFSFHEVVVGYGNGFSDIFHRPVIETSVFDYSAASPVAFNADAVLRLKRSDVAGDEIANTTRGLAADGDCAVRVMHSPVGYGYVLGWAVHPQSIGVLVRFKSRMISVRSYPRSNEPDHLCVRGRLQPCKV